MTDLRGGEEFSGFMGTGGRAGYRAEDEARPGYVDHVERARRRISELRAQYGDMDEEDSDVYLDRFFVEAPPGWTYEWKTYTVFGKTLSPLHESADAQWLGTSSG